MLNSKTTGSGDKLIIFVHGNSQSLNTWDTLIEQGALHEYTKVAIDLPGHGSSFHSLAPEIDYSVKGLALHLNDFLQQYADQDYILVGTSFGTTIISDLNPFPAACKGVFLSAAMVSSANLTVKDMVQSTMTTGLGFRAEATDEEIDLFIEDLIYEVDLQVKTAYRACFKNTDPNMRAYLGKSVTVPPALDRVANLISAQIPVAVVYGMQEKLVQPDYLTRTALPLWKDQILRIDNAGHCIELNQPAAMAGLIAEFAKECL